MKASDRTLDGWFARDLTEASSLGESDSTVAPRRAVSLDDLSGGDYADFRLNRAEVFAEAIEKLCSGESWNPTVDSH